MAVHLLLVRHAQHADLGRRLTGRAPGAPLTPEGEREAAALARRLAGEGIDEVYASPRERTRATAEPLAQAAGAPLAIVDALDEVDFGSWTGATFESLAGQPDWEAWNRARATARPPGGEGMADAAGRIAGHMTALAARRDGARIALVTHCDLIRALVATVLGLSLDNLLRFEVGPASVTRIEATPGWARLLTLNESAASWAAA